MGDLSGSGSGSGLGYGSGSGCGSGSGSGSSWFEEQREYEFTESMTLVVLIAIAVSFELWHHWLVHHVEHSTRRSSDGVDMLSFGGESFKRKLVARLDSEAMVLGVLAFLVWTVRTLGLFDLAVEGATDDALGPSDGGDLLHLVEDVHMHLFLGTMLYFVLIYNVLRHCEAQMTRWLAMEIVVAQEEGRADGVGAAALRGAGERRAYELYVRMRRVFIAWARGVEPGFPEDFFYAKYVVWSFDAVLEELIEISWYTWAFLAAVFAVHGALAGSLRYTDRGILLQSFGLAAVSVLLVGSLALYLRRQEVNLRSGDETGVLQKQFGRQRQATAAVNEQRRHNTDRHLERRLSGSGTASVRPVDVNDDDGDGVEEIALPEEAARPTKPLDELAQDVAFSAVAFKPNNEMLVLRLVSSSVFLGTYWLATYLTTPARYEDFSAAEGVKIVLLLLVGPVLCGGFVLPRMIAHFAALMSLPPNIDERDREVVEHVLLFFPTGCQPERGTLEDLLGDMRGERRRHGPAHVHQAQHEDDERQEAMVRVRTEFQTTMTRMRAAARGAGKARTLLSVLCEDGGGGGGVAGGVPGGAPGGV